jgi:hypothetical protein
MRCNSCGSGPTANGKSATTTKKKHHAAAKSARCRHWLSMVARHTTASARHALRAPRVGAPAQTTDAVIAPTA